MRTAATAKLAAFTYASRWNAHGLVIVGSTAVAAAPIPAPANRPTVCVASMRSVSLPAVSRVTIGALHVQNSRSPKPATTETTITCQLVWTSG